MGWEEKAHKITLSLIFILPVIAFTIFTLSLKRLPGCVYGCDIYRHFGYTQGIALGRPFWKDQVYQNQITWYTWISYLIKAYLHRLTGINLETIIIWSNLPFLILLIFLYYCLTKEFFGKEAALFSASLGLFFYGGFYLLGAKSLSVFFYVLSILFFYYAFNKNSWKYTILSGVMLGLCLLSSQVSVFALPFPILSSLFIFLVRKKITYKKIYMSVTIAIIGFLISILFWGPLLARYGFETSEFRAKEELFPEISGEEIRAPPILGQIKNLLRLGWSYHLIFTALAFFGIYSVSKKMDFKSSLALSSLISPILWFFHPYFTKPLLGFFIKPNFAGMHLGFLYACFAGVGLMNLLQKIKLKREYFVFIPAILTILSSLYYWNQMDTNKWYKLGKEELSPVFEGFREWTLRNTDLDSVFISSPMSSFMISALTSRFVVATYYPHTHPFVPYLPRYNAVNEFFTTTNITKALEIANEWNVSYVLLDGYTLNQYPKEGLNKLFEGNFDVAYRNEGIIIFKILR